MQFHLDGFRTGSPDVHPAAPKGDVLDVLIVGCGPAGLTLAAQLAAFPEIRTRIVEQKTSPLALGQADGIACRTMEMFNAFGFAEKVLREAYWVNETTFWKPGDTGDRIVRHGRIPDTEAGLSEFPHVILNQARVHDFYLEIMRNAPSRLVPDYGLRLADLTVPAERVASKNITVDRLIAAAQRILHPYTLDVKEVAWWSVYEIGQRLTDKFDDVPAGHEATRLPRVFIAGDACHTHSPKAGQGMNVSMQDTFNLGWKLAAVLRGLASPALLHTYSTERQVIAKELIDFDGTFARMFSARPKTSPDDAEGIDPAEFQRYFIQQGRFTAGTATRYTPSSLTGDGVHQALAAGFPVGMRFHSAPVVRLADAKPMHLGHAAEADGRWRLYLFAGADGLAPGSRLADLCDWLETDAASPVRRHAPERGNVDAVIDVRAVLQAPHQSLSMDELPSLVWPRKGRFGLRDYEKAFCADPAADIFDARGIDRQQGCVVIVRPDQYVADVLPLDAREALARYFDGALRQAQAALAEVA